jgi:hypothetical protein
MPDRAQPVSRLPPVEYVETDRTPLYGRPFKCKACGSREVTLFAIESQAELDAVQQGHGAEAARPAPTTHARPDPHKGLL